MLKKYLIIFFILSQPAIFQKQESRSWTQAATAAATAVDNLQIGTRNLLKKSKKYSLNAGDNNWSYWSVYWTEPL